MKPLTIKEVSEKYNITQDTLEYKIGRYEGAMKTGKLVWDEPSGCDCMKD